MGNLDHIRATLEQRGIVKLEGLVPVDEARIAHRKVTKLGEEYGVYSAGSWARSSSRFAVPKPFRNALSGLAKSNEFPDLVAHRLTPAIERLLGVPVTPLAPGQQILFSLPSDEQWSIPNDVWHTDLPNSADRTSAGVQVFTFLDDVDAQGGATLVVAGSHRLLNQYSVLSSKEVKAHLQKEEFFRTLFDPQRPAMVDPCDAVGSVGDVNLEVVELTGRVGDAYLMDLRVLHTPAPNASDKARIMPTCRFPRSDVAS